MPTIDLVQHFLHISMSQTKLKQFWFILVLFQFYVIILLPKPLLGHFTYPDSITYKLHNPNVCQMSVTQTVAYQEGGKRSCSSTTCDKNL